MSSSVRLDPDELWSWSRPLACMLIIDALELMSDSAGELAAFESSVRVVLLPVLYVSSWSPPDSSSEWPCAGPPSVSCFSRFRRYLARAFWNHTCNEERPIQKKTNTKKSGQYRRRPIQRRAANTEEDQYKEERPIQKKTNTKKSGQYRRRPIQRRAANTEEDQYKEERPIQKKTNTKKSGQYRRRPIQRRAANTEEDQYKEERPIQKKTNTKKSGQYRRRPIQRRAANTEEDQYKEELANDAVV